MEDVNMKEVRVLYEMVLADDDAWAKGQRDKVMAKDPKAYPDMWSIMANRSRNARRV